MNKAQTKMVAFWDAYRAAHNAIADRGEKWRHALAIVADMDDDEASALVENLGNVGVGDRRDISEVLFSRRARLSQAAQREMFQTDAGEFGVGPAQDRWR